ncbi:hypothetical protein FEM33_02285 [Dyadobacter flavalbus]|uniref:LVIVD repeat-containing protein n=1 Tax=Dyadobacter flavalbus TaxID=2579942 RepID=A0A5M8R216_9BACT|nr:hypothetical protein [Dyadobacter flavalbus]KAA6441360.1 hypothetical protein FEM33_02285 [Dyadobacter flavalbus]
MKAGFLHLLLFIVAFVSWSCNDQCTETRITRRLTPISRPLAEIRSSVRTEAAHTLKKPGKMYVKGNYLFINEIKEGIHIIDNSNPAAPNFISFINIPGNGDIAVKGNILYADSFSDLVALDISDVNAPKEVGRVNNVFQTGQFDGVWWTMTAPNAGIQDNAITDYKVEYVTETVSTNCEENIMYPILNSATAMSFSDMAFFRGKSASSSSNSGGTSGKAGSMSRFALHDNFLYTVSQSSLHLFNISKPSSPSDFSTINLGWNIETIFPYKNKLFIGSSTGMFIYDNSNPSAPQQLSVFQHGNACDPVVVHDDIAYVTLRTGTACAGTQNQMDLVDVSDASSPQLIRSYQMQNPHGLSIDFPILYLCEGEFGLKIFNAEDKMDIESKLLAHFKDMDAYDVISLGKTVLVIGKDGFYQYDASDVKNLRLLSKIPVSK